ncbi:YtxH domain-containing protein [Paenibacillus sp. 481]|uniref:YtxH domain-containing protein n=1 Tax=Paenibacillus sp. 481 TaxID=2835869 RepID=UPI001E48858C|nr:YtxH domain-containing protein [Paenibacillus sp. 481]UHA72556.1 YtxH domain-containing protein [Paenibacillus sp. 481]
MSKLSKPFWMGTIVGGIVGSVTALLFAPKPGKELRQDIVEGVHEVGEKSQQLAKQVGEHASEWATVAKEKSEEIKQSWKQWREEDKQSNTAVAQVSTTRESAGECADEYMNQSVLVTDDHLNKQGHQASDTCSEKVESDQHLVLKS